MIHATELRIGNLVECANEIWEVESVSSSAINAVHRPTENSFGEYSGFSVDQIKPIPLTEEWLLKFGFEQEYKSPMHSTYWIENLSYYFWHENKSQYANCKGLQIDCQFLHQLQNLYFALTGKELELKR